MTSRVYGEGVALGKVLGNENRAPCSVYLFIKDIVLWLWKLPSNRTTAVINREVTSRLSTSSVAAWTLDKA